jgi:2-polyprenyl-3-methyl-5-hydroxy-6-metoxy-1,4-benzoquinol methylase
MSTLSFRAAREAEVMRTFDCHRFELMDRPQADPRELRGALRDLERLNRLFGGHRYAIGFMKQRLQPGSSYRILDVGTGGADFPRAMIRWARTQQIRLRIDAVDASEDVLALAEEFSAGFPEMRFIQGRAQSCEFEGSYDLVHSSLTMHHFSAADAVSVLARCKELCRGWVLVTDLERSLFTALAVHAANALFSRQGMTLHDGDMSAGRAFSFREFSALAKGAGWISFRHERFLFCRQALWCRADGPGS